MKHNERIIHFMQNSIAHVRAIWIFGSYAKQCDTISSDIDIAVLTDWAIQPMPPLALWDIAQTLACMLNKDVDIIDMRRASTVMQYQVIVYGKRIFGHGLDIDLFECGVLSQKLALNELRATYLDDISARGTVYAR